MIALPGRWTSISSPVHELEAEVETAKDTGLIDGDAVDRQLSALTTGEQPAVVLDDDLAEAEALLAETRRRRDRDGPDSGRNVEPEADPEPSAEATADEDKAAPTARPARIDDIFGEEDEIAEGEIAERWKLGRCERRR